MLACLVSIGIALAFSITMNSPSGTWETSNSVGFSFTPGLQKESIPWCAVYVNDTTAEFSLKVNYSNVINGTIHTSGIAQNDTKGVTRYWNVSCYNGSDYIMGTATSFGVDSNPPSITLNQPPDGSYLGNADSNLTNMTFIPVDSSNPGNCSLYTNISGTWAINFSVDPFVSGELYGINLTTEPDGYYIWNVRCNDSVNSVWAETASNKSFTIDSVSPTIINITSPVNNTGSSDSTPEIVWNQTSDINFYKYEVSVATDFELTNVIQIIDITSITANVTNLSNLGNDKPYYIQVKAYDLAGYSTNSEFVLKYNLDTGTPDITLNHPSDESYLSDNTPDFNVTVVDDNPAYCVLYLTNSTGGRMAKNSTVAVTNNTQLNFTPIIEDGYYFFNVECNDTNGAKVNVSSTSLNVTIDTASPTPPNISSTWGATNNTDLTPLLIWVASTDTNLDYYVAEAIYTINSSIAYTQNVTTTYATMDLSIENTYNFNVTAYDKAVNINYSSNSTAETRYYVDSVCGTLESGWNLCGAVWTSAKNLSRIGAETSANMVSVWNTTNHVWATCNYQSSVSGTNCELDTMIGGDGNDANASHVWVYVNTSTNWRNRTWEATGASQNFTLATNDTQGWNIIPGIFRNGRNFRTLGNHFGQFNTTMFSMPYNNGTSAPYVNKGLFATSAVYNGTMFNYGRAMWVYYNNTREETTFDVGSW